VIGSDGGWRAGVNVSPDVTREERVGTWEAVLPPYAVILHNDDVNDMAHVVRALLTSVPGMTTEHAAEIMLEAHNHGQAEVIRCPLEHAELYRDRLESHGLTATIERV
jgi:ATP-dependent Clp protease adaptor protein ClpS